MYKLNVSIESLACNYSYPSLHPRLRQKGGRGATVYCRIT